MAMLKTRATAGSWLACASLGCLLADTAWGQDTLSFTREDIPLGSFGPRQSAAGDFNGDGHVDLVIGTSGSISTPPDLRILLGNGDGSFVAAPIVPSAREPGSINVADFNNDGRPDFAATHLFDSDVVAIYLGNGDGTFQAAPDIHVGSGDVPATATAGDFNGDGAPDLAVSIFFPTGENNVRIYLGNGDGTFAQGQDIVEGSPRALAVGDFNGDGEQDIAAIDFIFEHNRLLILLGQGDGTFAPVATEADVGPEAQSLTVGDFNGDGRQDVATADPNTDILSVLLGNGDGTFGTAQHLSPGVIPVPGGLVQPVSIKVGDFNGDGRLDLATGNRRPADPPIDSGVSILLGRGDGTFEPAQEFLTAEGTASLVVADFNDDGQPDLATANHETSSVTILLNDSAAETAVQIDIKPGGSANRVNPGSQGEIRVAVLTRDGFDAAAVDPATVRFGRTGTEAAPVHFALNDVDGDGNTDLVLRFRIQQTGISCGDTSASLTGRTFGGQAISGSDSIRTVGCRER